MKTLAPAVPQVLILGTRWQPQLSVQVAFRQDLLSRRPMPFPIALDRLLCVVPNRHSHCSQALHHALLRPKSSCCVTAVAFKLSALPFQGSPRTFFNSLITNLSLGGTRCNDLAFWTAFSVRMMCSSVIGALPTPDSMAPSLIQMACWHGCVLVHHSFSEWQYLARVRFPKNTHKRSSPVVFALEISSNTILHVKSTTQTRCCRLVVSLAEDPQVTTTSRNRHH